MALLRRFRMMDRDLRDKRLACRPRACRYGPRACRAHDRHRRRRQRRQGGVPRSRARLRARRDRQQPQPKSLPDGVRFVSLDELVAESDIVVLCCPLTPETTGSVSRERIAPHEAGRDADQRVARRGGGRCRPDRSACAKAGSAAPRSTSSRRSRCRPTIPIFASTT